MVNFVDEGKALYSGKKYTPDMVAGDLLGTIKDIEKAINSSGRAVKEVEGRGFLKSIFSSTSKDLIKISSSQNNINDLMLSLIQEIITLNLMSYSYLASVFNEFQKKVKGGWVDAEGRFQELSECGQTFANTATDIFSKIIEGSRSTQEKIELNSVNIQDLRRFLEDKNALDEKQSRDISGLKSELSEKSLVVESQNKRIEGLEISLEEKKKLIVDQSKKIEGMRQLLKDQEAVGTQMGQKLVDLVEDLKEKEGQGVSRDEAIINLNKLMDDLKLRGDNLYKKYKSLMLVSAILASGFVIMGVVVGLLVNEFFW